MGVNSPLDFTPTLLSVATLPHPLSTSSIKCMPTPRIQGGRDSISHSIVYSTQITVCAISLAHKAAGTRSLIQLSIVLKLSFV